MAAGKKVHLPGNEVGFLYTGWLHWQCEAANRLRAPTLFIGKWYFDNILVATVTREKPPQPKTPYCLHQVMMYEGLEGSFRGGKWDSTLMWPDRWKPGGESSYNFQLQHTLCHSDQFCWSQWTRVWEFNKKNQCETTSTVSVWLSKMTPVAHLIPFLSFISVYNPAVALWFSEVQTVSCSRQHGKLPNVATTPPLNCNAI